MYIFLVVCVCTNMYKDMWMGVCSPFCHGIVEYAIDFAEQRCPNSTSRAPLQTGSDLRLSLQNAQPLRGLPARRRFLGSGGFHKLEVFRRLMFSPIRSFCGATAVPFMEQPIGNQNGKQSSHKHDVRI